MSSPLKIRKIEIEVDEILFPLEGRFGILGELKYSSGQIFDLGIEQALDLIREDDERLARPRTVPPR